MSGFELNKIAAAILLASLITATASFLANLLYNPNKQVAQRGYQIEVTDDIPSNASASIEVEVKIDITELMQKANAELGKQVVKKCISCHSFDKDGPNKVGPNLWGVFGANKAYHANYTYSNALKAKGGVWNVEELFHFLHKPTQYIPGTKMSFVGLNKPTDIADVIAYLKTLQ